MKSKCCDKEMKYFDATGIERWYECPCGKHYNANDVETETTRNVFYLKGRQKNNERSHVKLAEFASKISTNNMFKVMNKEQKITKKRKCSKYCDWPECKFDECIIEEGKTEESQLEKFQRDPFQECPHGHHMNECHECMTDQPKEHQSEKVARMLHDIYEEEAKKAGWETQQTCKVEFDDLPEKNKIVMLKMGAWVCLHASQAVDEDKDWTLDTIEGMDFGGHTGQQAKEAIIHIIKGLPYQPLNTKHE